MKEKHAKFAEEKDKEKKEGKLFFACYSVKECAYNVWYIDNGCSNHMSANLEAFISLDQSASIQVKMGDGLIREACFIW